MPERAQSAVVETKRIGAASLLASLTAGFGEGVKSVLNTAGAVYSNIAYTASQISIDPILVGRIGESWRYVVDRDLTEPELRVVTEFLS